LKHNGKRREERRLMDPDAIDRVVRKYAATLGLDRRADGSGEQAASGGLGAFDAGNIHHLYEAYRVKV
jgi:hypothetical protein